MSHLNRLLVAALIILFSPVVANADLGLVPVSTVVNHKEDLSTDLAETQQLYNQLERNAANAANLDKIEKALALAKIADYALGKGACVAGAVVASAGGGSAKSGCQAASLTYGASKVVGFYAQAIIFQDPQIAAMGNMALFETVASLTASMIGTEFEQIAVEAGFTAATGIEIYQLLD